MRGALLLFLGLAACGANVRVQDGDGGAGGSEMDDTGAVSTTGTGLPNPSGGNGSGGAPSTGTGPSAPPPECFDSAAVVSPFPDLPVTIGQGLCDDAELQAFFDDCLGREATLEACDSFVSANPACASCIGGPDQMATSQPVLIGTPSGDFITVNYIACEAAAQGKLDCMGPAGDVEMCFWTHCMPCIFGGAAEDVDACLVYTSDGPCGQVPPSCQSLVDGSSTACTAPSLFESFMLIANAFCGAP